MKDELWECKDGRKVLVSNMEHSHVVNSLNMMARKHPQYFDKYKATMEIDPIVAKNSLRNLIREIKDINERNRNDYLLDDFWWDCWIYKD